MTTGDFYLPWKSEYIRQSAMVFKNENISGGVECKEYKKYLDAEEMIVPSAGKTESKAEAKDTYTFEEFLGLAGKSGFWINGFALFMYLGGIPGAFLVLSYQFLGATPEYWCHVQELQDANWTTQQIIDFAIPRKTNGDLEGCLQRDYNYSLAASMGYEVAKDNIDIITNVENGTLTCLTRDFNRTKYKSTLVTDFDLVCDRRAIYSTTSSITQVGMLFASLIVGYATDMYGKRRFNLVCHVIFISFGFLTAFSFNVEMFLFCKFIQSVFSMAAYITRYTLVLELSFSSQRSYISALGSIAWSVGQMLLPAIAYAVREWKYMQLIFISTFLYSISFFWLFPESPRWLILRGRYEEAIKIVKTIAYWNKCNLPSDKELLEMVKRVDIKGEETQEDQEEGSQKNMFKSALNQSKELFQTRTKTIRTLVLFFCWFTTGFVYYGIALISTSIGSNEYWYMFFGGLVEIPARLLLWPMLQYLGRRISLIVCYTICAASMLGSLGAVDSQAWRTTLSLGGKFAISASFSLVYLLAAEINTTKSRTLAVGISSVVARFGSISSPYVNDILGDTHPKAPSMMYGILSCVAALLAFILPETRKAILPESLSDAENLGPSKKKKDCDTSTKTEDSSSPST